MHAYAFSPNGQWMVIEAAGLGFVRVDTKTHHMQLFSTEILSYNLGFTPKVMLAISDDGNSVIKSGSNVADTMAYDLSGCQPGLFTINGNNTSAVTGCRSRLLTTNLKSQMADFAYFTGMHFHADGKSLSLLASHKVSSGAYEYFNATYAIAGYQQPHTNYIALGDSFSSGEGAFGYESGTDSDSPVNKCHLSTHSYPYLTAQTLGITSFHSVACSGATTQNYYHDPQGSRVKDSLLGDWLPGYRAQKDYVDASANTSVITISMIGNDVGFKDKLASCLEPGDCFHFKEEREMVANEFYSKFDALVSLYRDIKNAAGNSEVKIYVLGYPQIFGSQNCQVNVPFSLEERQMAQDMTSYLDAVIKAATIKAGVQYIDVEHAFDGYRLCDAHTSDALNLSSAAVNGLIRGGDNLGLISNGSFHPNALGQQMMSQALVAQSQGFMAAMPAAIDNAAAPYIGSGVYGNFIGSSPAANFPDGLLYTSPTTLV